MTLPPPAHQRLSLRSNLIRSRKALSMSHILLSTRAWRVSPRPRSGRGTARAKQRAGEGLGFLRSTLGLASAVYSAILFGAQDEYSGCKTLTRAPASRGAVPLPQAGEAKRLCADQDVTSGKRKADSAWVGVRARMLLRFFFCTALLQATTAACLLPPPVSIEQGVNSRPFVLTEQVRPAQATVELNLNCQKCTFTLQADDPDAGDTIYSRWFWDYDQGGPNTGIFDFAQIPPATGVLRVPDEYTFILASRFPSEAFVNTTHTLEVVLSDREFQTGEATPFNRAPIEGAGLTSFRWNVKLVRRGTRCDDVQNVCTAEGAE